MNRYNPKKVRLSERDLLVIEQVGKLGILALESVKRIFDNKSHYYINRMKVLCNKKYLIRKSNCFTLGTEGKKLLECQGKKIKAVPADKEAKERLSRVSKLLHYIDQTTWEFIPSWNVKSNWKVEFNRGSRFYGMLSSKLSAKNQYLIYNIGKAPSACMINRIQTELKTLHQKKIDKVIVLGESEEAMRLYPIKDNFLTEQLFIPYSNQGIDIINFLGKVDILEVTSKYIYGDTLKQANWRVVDFEIISNNCGKSYVVNLVTNDIQKRFYLNNYLQFRMYRNEELIEIEIICMDWQYNKFSNDYKNCKINVITHKELTKLINKKNSLNLKMI